VPRMMRIQSEEEQLMAERPSLQNPGVPVGVNQGKAAYRDSISFVSAAKDPRSRRGDPTNAGRMHRMYKTPRNEVLARKESRL